MPNNTDIFSDDSSEIINPELIIKLDMSTSEIDKINVMKLQMESEIDLIKDLMNMNVDKNKEVPKKEIPKKEVLNKEVSKKEIPKKEVSKKEIPKKVKNKKYGDYEEEYDDYNEYEEYGEYDKYYK